MDFIVESQKGKEKQIEELKERLKDKEKELQELREKYKEICAAYCFTMSSDWN